MKIFLKTALLLTIHSFFWTWLYRMNYVTPAENGIMENTQILFLAVSSLLFFKSSLHQDQKDKKFLFLGLAILSFNFMVREIEINKLEISVHPFLLWLRHGSGFNLIMGSVWGIFLIKTFRHTKTVWKYFVTWMTSANGMMFLVGGIFLIISIPLDKEVLGLSEKMTNYTEELFELNGFLLMLISSLLTYLRFRHSSQTTVS